MSDLTFDPKTILETYRAAFAPVMKAQQEGVKVIDRVGRYQYAVAGDYLEWSLAQAQAVVGAKSPAEIVAKQTELGSKISEQLRGRVQELNTIASEAQSTLSQLFTEASAKAAELTKKAA